VFIILKLVHHCLKVSLASFVLNAQFIIVSRSALPHLFSMRCGRHTRMLRWLQTSIFGSPVRSFSHIDFGSDFNPDFRTRRKLLQEHMGGGLDLVTQPFGPEFPTLHDVMQKAFADYASLPCVGTREYIKMHKGTRCAGDYVAGGVFRFMCA
jgi:hypothetical protein